MPCAPRRWCALSSAASFTGFAPRLVRVDRRRRHLHFPEQQRDACRRLYHLWLRSICECPSTAAGRLRLQNPSVPPKLHQRHKGVLIASRSHAPRCWIPTACAVWPHILVLAGRRWHFCTPGRPHYAFPGLGNLRLLSDRCAPHLRRRRRPPAAAETLGPASVASVPHRPCAPRQGHALSSAASLTACVPHAPCEQAGGAISSYQSGGVTLTKGSTIVSCRTELVRPRKPCAPQAVLTA